MNKKYFVVVDTETAGSLSEPLPFDIGWAIVDKKGTVYETFSFIVYEIFCKEKELMETSYYHEKLPKYWQEIKAGQRQIKSFWDIRKIFLDSMKRYNITDIYAYNMNFDKKALNCDTKKICSPKLKNFFPKNTEFKCIWKLACDLLMARPSYIRWAEKNGLENAKGNLPTNAETCYKYITGNLDFEESHTGLEDVLIENAILAKCFRQKKKMDATPKASCWQTVQKKRREITLA